MLTPPEHQPLLRNRRRERRLWQNEGFNTPSMGCAHCPEKDTCGGLAIKQGAFDCLQFCCNEPATCDRVCRNNPDYVDRVREIDGFKLDKIPRMPSLQGPSLPHVVPVIFHGHRRQEVLVAPAAAIPLSRMFNKQTGACNFSDHATLCNEFKIAQGTCILLTGTDIDRPLERWWGLEEAGRRTIIKSLKAAGVQLVTTPNYSLFTDRPRWDDLHAMKRIQITHREFLTEGMPAALHVNGRTEADFHRWANYLTEHPEIEYVACEFATGAGWTGRREQHVIWLTQLAVLVGRPLHLIVRGGIEVLPMLSAAFARITFLETASFMKTVKRQKAVPAGNSRMTWQPAPTAIGEPLDVLFNKNRAEMESLISTLAAPPLSNRVI